MHSIRPLSENDRNMTESRQALELRKFFVPYETSESTASEHCGFNSTLNDDGALDAYIQTIVWRLKGAHAMVSLIDKGTQYFLAGASRVAGDGENGLLADAKWFGCSTVPTPGGLCENTLALEIASSEYPCFVVPDLSKDVRFADLPVVNGTVASYRFYAGTPITTSHGINIGSLFFFDDKPRQNLTTDQRKFLRQRAANIMHHLETKREAAERRRVALMSKGIATFLERTRESNPHHDEENDHSTQVEDAEGNLSPKHDIAAKELVLDKIRMVLDHAAEILRESLEINLGGVVFLDPTIGHHTESGNIEDKNTDLGSNVDAMEKAEETRKSSNGFLPPSILNDDDFRGLSQSSVRSSIDKHKPAKVLSISTSKITPWDTQSRVLDGKTLQSLIDAYPDGNVWYMDEEGYFSSLEQIQELEKSAGLSLSGRARSLSSSDTSKQRGEAAMLAKVFHKARQIIFLPLWDAAGDRWYAGCFVWSQSAVPVFTVDSEISYLSAFTNLVMVEISRLDALTANKVKSDFISSISHEFRSPLHGILASAEFLRESNLNTSQLEFISTIQSCGGTLLDTINHVLDYSKINSFEKSGNSQGTVFNELWQVTNLALLCEDIVNGMIAANEYRGGASRPAMLNEPETVTSQHLKIQNDHPDLLPIVFDIESCDWEFRVQAGALQRVLMNVFGNAQKYTDSGYIMVRLRIQDSSTEKSSPADPPGKILSLCVRDSGRGMSSEYMERKLYHPFSQEDTFAPGVGLGLSIVWSIVNQLGGKIHIRSELGIGTDVEVTLPVENAENSREEIINTEVIPDTSTIAIQSMHLLQQATTRKSVAIVHSSKNKPQFRQTFWKCIERYCSEWFGMEIKTSEVDLIITDEFDVTKYSSNQRVLVVHQDILFPIKRDADQHLIADICNPVGPFRLAKSILALLDRNPPINSKAMREDKKDVGTQTPAGSPEERRIMKGIILTDYGFPKQSLSDPIASQSDFDSAKSPSPASPIGQQDSGTENVLACMKALSLQNPSALDVKRPQNTTTIDPSALSNHIISSPVIVPPTEQKPHSGLNILAVDDNSVNLQLLCRYLQKRKSDTITKARSGLGAVEAYKIALTNPEKRLQTFDIIFMDISMPEMDGFEATRIIRRLESEGEADKENKDREDGVIGRVRGKGKRAHVVALTGLASRRDRAEAVESGLDGFMTKPVSFSKIGELLMKLESQKEMG